MPHRRPAWREGPSPRKQPRGSSTMRESQTGKYEVVTLTQLIKVRLDAVGSRHRTDESGFQKRAPFVNQTAVSAVVVLRGGMTRRSVIRPNCLRRADHEVVTALRTAA